jgi:hypothetical protein
MVEELSREEMVEAVDRTVTELLLAAKVVTPPIDAVVLARKHLVLPENPKRRPGQRKQADSFTTASPEQQQWEAALQIGDHLKTELLRRLGIDPNQPRPMMGESPSKLLAEHLLLPVVWFAKDALRVGFDVLSLKESYGTASHELIAWRMLDLSEPCIITLIDNDHVQRRRSNAWPVRKELAPPEQQCQQYVSHYSRPRVVRADGWTVQGWPVHRSDWKREILRSVVESAD